MTHINLGGEIDLATIGQNFEMIAGEERILAITVTEVGGAIKNLSDFTAKWVVTKFGTDHTPLITKSLGKGIVITDVSNGKIQITLTPEDTKSLNGAYYHELIITSTIDGLSEEVLDGTARIELEETSPYKLSYVKVADADIYFDTSRLYDEAWGVASPEDKSAALMMATNRIDTNRFRGRKTDAMQTLEFPRSPDVTIPKDIRIACCEEALSLLKNGNTKRAQLQEQGVTSFSMGDLREVYERNLGMTFLSNEAERLVRNWKLRGARIW